MWIDYFFQVQKKYTMQLGTQKPLVIRLDGKGVTKDKTINFFSSFSGSFSDILEKAAWYFTKRYECYAIFGTDEISFIFPKPLLLFEDIQNDLTYFSNETISVFSQYFFDYFNTLYQGEKIFWHAKCFSISEEKLTKYVKYRMGTIKNVLTTYFLKKNNIRKSEEKLNVRLEECMKLKDFSILNDKIDGTLYYCGDKIDIHEFLEGKIKKSENNVMNQEKEPLEIEINILDM